MRLEHSRGIRLAARAAGREESVLERALEGSRIVISADEGLPGAITTTRILLTTLRRQPGQLVLERDGLSRSTLDEMMAAVSAVDPDRPLTIGRSSRANVRLHVGAGRGDEAIRVVPEAHGAHVAGQRTAVVRPRRPASALGAIYTAALGASEAFKHVAHVRPNRRALHRHLRFCPVSLTNDLSAAPLATGSLEIEATLVGVGAIGTGIALILSELPLSGRVLAVDYEKFELENRGTYSLGGASEAASRPDKIDLAKSALAQFDVIPFPYPIEHLPAAIDEQRVPWFPLVLAGLDSAQARRETQRLWPDWLIDAATGDTMLGLHEHIHATGPCMTCYFPIEREGPSSAEQLAEVLGLPVELLAQDRVLTEEHLADVSPEQRAMLTPHLGKSTCGLARAAGLTDLAGGTYQPSVPHISLQAAALAVGRLLARKLDVNGLPNLVQYDGLFGPQAATLETMTPDSACYCQTHAERIDKVRAWRQQIATLRA